MGTKVRTCCLLMFLQMLSMIQGQELVKRVPQGFLGMRGKKYYDSEEFDQYIKRKPQFFVGVKGKKNFLDYLRSNYDQYYKRAPMGFIGMRGKKDSFEDSYEYIPKQGSLIGEIDYTASKSYPEESLAFPYLNRLLEEYQKQRNIEDSNEIHNNEDFNENNDQATVLTKRAAHMKQFFGVRGKKVQNKRPFDLSFRGKFVGVRGKKDLKNSGYGGMNYLLDQEEPWPKRKGQMSGFFGMRGKKWMDESTAEEAQN